MSGFSGPQTIMNNLLLSMDFNNTKCYPETGTAVTDLIGRTAFTLLDSSYYTYSNGTIQFTRTTSPALKDGGGLHATASGSLTASNFLYNDHTWEIWARIDDRNPGVYTGSENSSILSVYAGYHSGFTYNASSITYIIWNATTNVATCSTWTLGTSGTNVIEGQWFQIAVTRSGNLFTPYVNGVSSGTGATQSPSGVGTGSSNLLALGKTQDVAAGDSVFVFYSKNTISQMRMYNRALSAEEILNNFNAHRGRFGI